MQDKGVHIDILFRNGLQGLEVLPPPMVWESIAPVAAGRARRRVFLTAAATVAVLIAMASSLWLVTDLIQYNVTPGTLTLNQDSRPQGFLPSEPVMAGNDVTSQSKAIETIYKEPEKVTQTVLSDLRQSAIEIISPVNITFESPDGESMGFPDDQSFQELPFPLTVGRATIFDAFSGENELSAVEPGKTERWLIGAGFSPSYIMSPGSQADPDLRAMIESEQMQVTYSGGVSVSFTFSKRLSVSTGLYYSSMGHLIDNVSTYSGFAPYVSTKGSGDMTISTTSGKIVSTNSDLYLYDKTGSRVSTAFNKDIFDPVKSELPFAGSNLVQNFGYLEMPLMIRYKLVDRNIDINLLGGVSYSLLVGNSVYALSMTGEKIPAGYTDGVSPFNISSSMGVGMAYNLSGSLSFNLEPMIRYNLSSLGYRTTGIPHPLSMGLFTGFFYRF